MIKSFRKLGARNFDGEFEIFFFALLGDFQNFVGAALFFTEEVERVANHDEFEIRGGGARDDGAAHVFKKDALRFGLLLEFFRLAAKWFVNDLLGVSEAEERGGAAAGSFGDAEGVACAGACVDVREELGFGDVGGAVGERGLEFGDLEIFGVLQGELDGVFESEADWSWACRRRFVAGGAGACDCARMWYGNAKVAAISATVAAILRKGRGRWRYGKS